MPVSLASFGLDRLTRDERFALAHALLDSITAEQPPGGCLTADQVRELERRADEADADPDGGIPWDEVKARARAGWR